MSFGVWNNIDELALYLGLERLSFESNEDFYIRLKKFAKYRHGADYYTQVHSIPLQVGLDSNRIGEIVCSKPYLCSIDWEYVILENEDEYVRIFINTPNCTIEKISLAINASETFRFVYEDESFKAKETKTLIRNTNQKIINEKISKKTIHLKGKNIIESSFMIDSNFYIINRVSSIQDIRKRGDYFVDFINGYIETYDSEYPSVKISYKTYEPEFAFEVTDINFIPVNLIAKYGITNELISIIPYILSGQVWGV